MKVLVLNAGSSSQKIRLYEMDGDGVPSPTPPPPLWAADAEWGSQAEQATITLNLRGKRVTTEYPKGERAAILSHLLQQLWQGALPVIKQPAEIDVVGHRVVHGGAKYQESVLITPEVMAELRELIPFAPLHAPVNIEGIEIIGRVLGQVPQVAVFDTAFHRHLPQVAQVYPGPYAWLEHGIRRYGFHGISHEYCAHRSTQLVGRDPSSLRIVTCHLGNGCSLAAIRGGQSIDTTMGFTPLEGLMMGTRSGTIDPAILLYLQREHDVSLQELMDVLNYQSGLKGISGISGDMRTVMQAARQGNERAQLALDLYVYRLRSSLGSMIAALEGIDVLTFTGGVGEHAREIRARVCRHFGFLGLALDDAKNAAVDDEDQDIAAEHSTARILVVHTEEDWQIACSSRNTYARATGQPAEECRPETDMQA